MIRVLYFSTARPHVDSAEVDRIVARAMIKNRQLGVTGALAYNGRNFCQVLEGARETIETLMHKIEHDERHAGFKLLDHKEIAAPHFRDWSMERVDALDFSVVINAMNA